MIGLDEANVSIGSRKSGKRLTDKRIQSWTYIPVLSANARVLSLSINSQLTRPSLLPFSRWLEFMVARDSHWLVGCPSMWQMF